MQIEVDSFPEPVGQEEASSTTDGQQKQAPRAKELRVQKREKKAALRAGAGFKAASAAQAETKAMGRPCWRQEVVCRYQF